MHKLLTGFGLLALIGAVTAGFAKPASAEFFGCNDQHRVSSYSTRSYSVPPRRSYSGSYTHEFAAQSSRRPTASRRTYRTYPAGWR
jgi:hypothetical protein